MFTNDASSSRYVTARYGQLQGFRLVPLALVFLAAALWRGGALALPGDRLRHGAEAWFVGGVTVSVAMSFVIRRWYNRNLGSVGQLPGHSGAIPILATAALAGAATWLQVDRGWHLPLGIVVVGVALLMIGTREYRFRPHYVAGAAALIAYAFLPLTGAGMNVLDAAFDGAIGLSLLIVGVGDHLLLTHALRPPTEKLA